MDLPVMGGMRKTGEEKGGGNILAGISLLLWGYQTHDDLMSVTVSRMQSTDDDE